MKLSVIGVGNIGRAIIKALVASGHEVTVFNRTRAKADALASLPGIRVAGTAAEAIAASGHSILALFDAPSTRAVLEAPEVLAILRGKALISVTVMDAADAIELSRTVAAQGGRYSDMNVLAYPHLIETRGCEYALSCHPDDAATWSQLIRGIARAVYEVGAVGNSQKVMFALAMSYMYQTIAIGSAVAAFERQGLPLCVAQMVLTTSPTLAIASAEYLIPEMARRQYGSDQWSVDNMVIVCDQVAGFSDGLGIDASVIRAIREMYVKASKLGYGSKDVTALYEVLNPRG